MQGFSFYHLGAVWANKASNPPKGPTCAFEFSECPCPMDRILFSVAAVSPSVRILTTTVHWLAVGTAQHLKCHQSAAQGFSWYHLGPVWAKKASHPPKGPTCAFEFSECPFPMGPIPFSVAVASPSVRILTTTVHWLPVGTAQHLQCQQSGVQRISFYRLGRQLRAVWAGQHRVESGTVVLKNTIVAPWRRGFHPLNGRIFVPSACR